MIVIKKYIKIIIVCTGSHKKEEIIVFNDIKKNHDKSLINPTLV